MDARQPVVVGLGSGRDGFAELDWAAREALVRGAQLRVIRTYHLAEGTQPWPTATDRMLIEDLRQEADRLLATALDHVRQRWPDLPVRCMAVDGIATRVLVDESHHAALTLVGAARRKRLRAIRFTTVDRAVAAQAAGPVVVVNRAPAERPAEPEVYVGLDLSGEPDELLGFAFEYAHAHRRFVHALLCRRPGVEDDALLTSELCGLWDALARWRARYPDVAARAEILDLDPVTGLVSASAGHDLLVVGGRGTRHPWLAERAGSVSQRVLGGAGCPVAVVHPPTPETRTPTERAHRATDRP